MGGAKTYLSCLFFFLLCFSSHSFSFVLFIFFHFFFIQFFPFSCSFIFSFRALNSVSFSSIYSRLYFLYRSFSLVTSFHSVPFWFFFQSHLFIFFYFIRSVLHLSIATQFTFLFVCLFVSAYYVMFPVLVQKLWPPFSLHSEGLASCSSGYLQTFVQDWRRNADLLMSYSSRVDSYKTSQNSH